MEATSIVATDESKSTEGEGRLAQIANSHTDFDYVGGEPTDPSLLREARRAYIVDPSRTVRARAEESSTPVTVLSSGRRGTLSALFRALRPHQWAKNGLLLMPIVAAHLAWDTALAADVVAGLVSFSLMASGVYLANDLADLPHDRRHRAKQDRPLASGDLSIRTGVIALVGLIVASLLLALRLPTAFAITLLVYLVLNAAYSWGLKQLLALDVIVLAALYTVRVVAGAALARIELSAWFLAFSTFLFLSLAVLKRVLELQATEDGSVSGRSYRPGDLPVLQAVGPAAGVMSALVYCLYITGPVRELYQSPDLLWLGLPLLLYWIVRVWLLAVRGEIEEDPVVFVVRDRPSYLTLAAFLAVVFLAV